MKYKNQQEVFILGIAGFPVGGARIEKLKLFGKALVRENLKVQFLSNSWSMMPKGILPVKGTLEGLNYLYTSMLTYRPNSFILRRAIKFIGCWGEILYLFTHKCDAAIVSVVSGNFFSLFKYWAISRIIGYRIFYPHHEDENVQQNNKGWIGQLNLYLFKRFAFSMVDGAFPISTYLENKIKLKNNKLPILRIPAMVDFDSFSKRRIIDENYFLFCGSLGYFDVIHFIIESFEHLSDKEIELHLVCNGTFLQKKKLKERISNSVKKKYIRHFSFISYDELVKKYINAKALLIPLRNSIQDIARFPHKIGEYTASGRPIITNRIGDIELYFKNEESALIASKMDVDEYSLLMKYVIEYPVEANAIGVNGMKIGKKHFDYKSYSKSIVSFMGMKLL